MFEAHFSWFLHLFLTNSPNFACNNKFILCTWIIFLALASYHFVTCRKGFTMVTALLSVELIPILMGCLNTQVGDKIESGQRQKICSVAEGNPDLDPGTGARSSFCPTAWPQILCFPTSRARVPDPAPEVPRSCDSGWKNGCGSLEERRGHGHSCQ